MVVTLLSHLQVNANHAHFVNHQIKLKADVLELIVLIEISLVLLMTDLIPIIISKHANVQHALIMKLQILIEEDVHEQYAQEINILTFMVNANHVVVQDSSKIQMELHVTQLIAKIINTGIQQIIDVHLAQHTNVLTEIILVLEIIATLQSVMLIKEYWKTAH